MFIYQSKYFKLGILSVSILTLLGSGCNSDSSSIPVSQEPISEPSTNDHNDRPEQAHVEPSVNEPKPPIQQLNSTTVGTPEQPIPFDNTAPGIQPQNTVKNPEKEKPPVNKQTKKATSSPQPLSFQGMMLAFLRLRDGNIIADTEFTYLPGKIPPTSQAAYFFRPEFFKIGGSLNVSSSENFNILKSALASHFKAGKKLVTTKLGNNMHAVAAAFRSDGKYRIVDSMGGKAVDIQALDTRLTLAKISDPDGNHLQFQGEYINTMIQKADGGECSRFSSLYAYHMAVREDWDAFEEVNGAFVEGLLTQFEDHSKIGTYKLRNMSHYGREIYDPFMIHWSYQSFGWNVHSWKELALREFMGKQNFFGDFGIWLFSANDFPGGIDQVSNANSYLAWVDGQNHETEIKGLTDIPKSILRDLPSDLDTQIGELVPDSDGVYALVIEKGKDDIRLLHLEKSEGSLYSIDRLSGKKRKLPRFK